MFLESLCDKTQNSVLPFLILIYDLMMIKEKLPKRNNNRF